jgi:CBS domain-containing protein
MSPRAACRLEALGFGDVYDYVAGKADWLARGLPREGQDVTQRRAIDVLAADVVTCALGDRADDVADRIAASRYGYALVVSEGGVLLGRVRGSALGREATIDAAIEPGLSTIRADAALESLAERMTAKDIASLPVTTPDGELLGVVRRDDLDR